ncbi:MAG TPA: ribokinase [Terriglobia bacterium]|nr:ribokinase [Terriglobia bacterium]
MPPQPLRIIAIGSTIFDLVAQAPRVPREGEVVVSTGLKLFSGGKAANRAVALARLGAVATLISAVGEDVIGDFVLDKLKSSGIDVSGVHRRQGVNTGCSWVALLPSGNNATFVDPAANFTLTANKVESAAEDIARADAVSLDLEVPLEAVEAALRLARRAGKLAVLDAGPPRACPLEILRLADVVSPNEPELEALTGQPVSDVDSARHAAGKLIAAGVKVVVVKLGSAGSMLVTVSGSTHFPAFQVAVVDPTGAGDAFTAALTVQLACGTKLEDAVRYANMAGALAVTRLGAQASLPTRAEIEAFAAGKPRQG